eukprot:scaffold15531_cov42-Phaeocystis_antarctica.AAC.1
MLRHEKRQPPASVAKVALAGHRGGERRACDRTVTIRVGVGVRVTVRVRVRVTTSASKPPSACAMAIQLY